MLVPVVTLALSFSSTPSADQGCFNFYSGSCSGCGKPALCGVSPHDGTQGFAMPTFYTGTSSYCAHCPNEEGCWDGSFAGGPEHCTCVTENECIANSPGFVSCSACGADGDPPLKELPQPTDAGCFNYYGGSCSGCGRPKICSAPAMPTFYTGSSSYCDHCPSKQGCWDGSFSGGPEHCTCVTEDKCIANSPGYVSCSICGADGDPALKELPQLTPSCLDPFSNTNNDFALATNYTQSVTLGDLGGDSAVDVVAGEYSILKKSHVFVQQPGGGFIMETLFSSDSPTCETESPATCSQVRSVAAGKLRSALLPETSRSFCATPAFLRSFAACPGPSKQRDTSQLPHSLPLLETRRGRYGRFCRRRHQAWSGGCSLTELRYDEERGHGHRHRRI